MPRAEKLTRLQTEPALKRYPSRSMAENRQTQSDLVFLPLGVDIMMPDVRFLEDNRDDLLGLVLTHGHEDHLGAVAHLWPRLRCPVYATPFTARLLSDK